MQLKDVSNQAHNNIHHNYPNHVFKKSNRWAGFFKFQIVVGQFFFKKKIKISSTQSNCMLEKNLRKRNGELFLQPLSFSFFIPHYIFQMAKKLEGQKETGKKTPKCAVCMQKNAHVSINCVHKFCMKCISKWTKRNQTCPLCRADISEIKYGTRTKQVKRRRRRQTDRRVDQPRPRFRITWKPILIIGIPCMPGYMPSPFLFNPPLH